jgi:AraC family transcriptional regulator of adaptative response/methylated-DNA-[protein]-cysteine methyltransferase
MDCERKMEDTYTTDESRWDAVTRRDLQAAGAFVYGVVTTGVYCLPGCPSRLPKRGNVRFFASPGQAERAGFRPCMRCRPPAQGTGDLRKDAIVAACRVLEAAEQVPKLRDLAAAAGLSPSHFHRLFKKIVGITPGHYAAAQRARRLRHQLDRSSTVTDALYDAGYGSGSRFYEKMTETLGMKASLYRKGGKGMLIQSAAVQSSYLGWVLVAATNLGVCSITMGDTPEALQEGLHIRFPQAEFRESDPGFAEVVAKVISLIESPRGGFDLPLDIQGSAFQQRVWMALRDIPAGATVSYRELAVRIGSPKAVRAVATACAANTVAVAVPCHRVVRSDGNLAGYRWGIERKRALLEREAVEEKGD